MNRLLEMMGLSNLTVSHTEKIVSAIGGFISILFILLITHWVIGTDTEMIIVASMGASTVLLFAVPHGPMSQPWPVLGGNVVSAMIGVFCFQVFSNTFFSASLAVGAAIGAMYYLKCIHPPGGATALAFVSGGPAIHELGYQYVVTPVLLNVLAILLVAVLFNGFFSWRRYPAFLQAKVINRQPTENRHYPSIRHEDFVYALSAIDSLIDVSERDLLLIYDLATQKLQADLLGADQLKVMGFYSNGKFGNDWSVRQIIQKVEQGQGGGEMIKYKVVAGVGRRQSGIATKNDFLNWAAYPVERDEENWKKVDQSGKR